MKYQNGITREEPSLTILEAAKDGNKIALMDCLLIIVMCVALILIPIFGLVSTFS